MEQILNLTQHLATPEQIAQGVIEPEDKAEVQHHLTFDCIPDKDVIIFKATMLSGIARKSGAKKAMIGGAPYLMSTLEAFLKADGITPVYAYSERKSQEQHMPDGTVRKVNVFEHIGFIEA